MSEEGEKGGWWGGHKEMKTRMAVYFGGGVSGSFRGCTSAGDGHQAHVQVETNGV